MKKYIPLLLLLTGCTGLGLPGQTTNTGTSANPSASLIVSSLTPICSSTLRDRDVIPQAARNLGIDEDDVCECGLRRAEARVIANPALLIEVLRSTDASINLLVSVGGECTAELVSRALTGQPAPGQTANPGNNPFPFPNPGRTPEPIPTPPPR